MRQFPELLRPLPPAGSRAGQPVEAAEDRKRGFGQAAHFLPASAELLAPRFVFFLLLVPPEPVRETGEPSFPAVEAADHLGIEDEPLPAPRGGEARGFGFRLAFDLRRRRFSEREVLREPGGGEPFDGAVEERQESLSRRMPAARAGLEEAGDPGAFERLAEPRRLACRVGEKGGHPVEPDASGCFGDEHPGALEGFGGGPRRGDHGETAALDSRIRPPGGEKVILRGDEGLALRGLRGGLAVVSGRFGGDGAPLPDGGLGLQVAFGKGQEDFARRPRHGGAEAPGAPVAERNIEEHRRKPQGEWGPPISERGFDPPAGGVESLRQVGQPFFGERREIGRVETTEVGVLGGCRVGFHACETELAEGPGEPRGQPRALGCPLEPSEAVVAARVMDQPDHGGYPRRRSKGPEPARGEFGFRQLPGERDEAVAEGSHQRAPPLRHILAKTVGCVVVVADHQKRGPGREPLEELLRGGDPHRRPRARQEPGCHEPGL